MINRLMFFFKTKVFSKIFIFLFYLVLLLFFLYIPYFYDLFFPTKNIINVCTFTDMISPKVVKRFKEKTGISVRLKHFDTNDELVAKFKIDKGRGYDLVVASDRTIDILRREKFLRKIDRLQLSNSNSLDSRLFGYYFDPFNEYSLPMAWSVEGIVYNKSLFEKNEISWDTVFSKPKDDFKICMTDEGRDCVFFAALYLYNKVTGLTGQQLEVIKDLLIKQKRWVEIYTSGSLQYYLMADVVPLAVASSAFARKLLEESSDFDFVVPEKGSILFIESVALPVISKKSDLAYKFIDFLLSEQSSITNCLSYGYNPANKKAFDFCGKQYGSFDNLQLINNEVDSKIIGNIWLAVRLS